MTQQTADIGGGMTAIWDNEVAGPLTFAYDGVGTGYMNDYSLRDKAPWNADTATINGLDFSNVSTAIKSIGTYAFNGMTFTIGLVLPATLEKIGTHAFSNCTGIYGTVTIPININEIGESAFSNCQSITSIVFEGSLSQIKSSTFANCLTLTSIQFPLGLTEIGMNAFAGDVQLSGEMRIPATVTSIGSSAFSNCRSINTLKFEEGSQLTTIGSNAFSNCSGIEGSLSFPETLENIGVQVFSNCAGITGHLNLAKNITTIGSNAFAGTGITEVFVSNNITTFGTGVFKDCISLVSARLSDSVKEIPNETFSGCSALTTVTGIPGDITRVGTSAFSGCSSYGTDFVLPATVTDIGAYAFKNCYAFDGKSFEFRSEPKLGGDAFAIGDFEHPVTITIKSGGWATEENIPHNQYTILIFEEPKIEGQCGDTLYYSYSVITGIMEITGTGEMWDYNSSEHGFSTPWSKDGGYIHKVSFADGITKIGHNAFNGCDLQGPVSLPTSVETINDYAFYGCSKITVINPTDVKSVGSHAFYGCNGLTTGIDLSRCESISDYAFYNCSSVQTLLFGSKLQSIGSHAFYGCNKVSNIYFGLGLITISDYAFYGCDSLTTLAIPAVQTVGASAFSNCHSITSLSLPSGCSISSNAFYTCDKMTEVNLHDVKEVANGAFDNCPSVTSLTMTNDTMPILNDGCFGFGYPGQKATVKVNAPSWATEESFAKLGNSNTEFVFDKPKPTGEELCFTANNDGSAIAYVHSGSVDVSGIQYSLNGAEWVSWNGAEITLNAKDRLYVSNKNNELSRAQDQIFKFVTKSNLSASGNIMSMINYATLTPYCFCSMFEETAIISAPDMPASDISDFAYFNMFCDCANITEPPEMPELTSVGEAGCQYMFYGCSKLTKAPILNCKALGIYSFFGMFYNCSSLTKTPTLPEAKLFSGCYGRMFCNCSSLKIYDNGFGTAFFTCPTNLPSGSVQDMFKGTGGGYTDDPTPGSTYYYLEGNPSGQCGDALYWELDVSNGILIITGSGESWSYGEGLEHGNKAPWYEYRDLINSVSLPEGLTYIGYRFMEECSSTTGGLTIPDTVTDIGLYAFAGAGFTTVSFGKSLFNIDYNAFENSKISGTLNLSSGIEQIGSNAFKNCPMITEINFPEKLRLIGQEAFSGCYGLDKGTITFASSGPATMDKDSLAFGTDGNPVTVNVNASWATEEYFNAYVGGDHTTFVLPVIHDDYMYFVPTEEGCSVSFETTGKVDLTHLKYSFDKQSWNDWKYSAVNIPYVSTIEDSAGHEIKVTRVINSKGQTISVPMGQKLYVWNENDQLSLQTADNDRFTFKISGRMECHGNVMSMINFTELKDYCFNRLFMNCTTLLTSPELPALVLTQYCYQLMFSGCIELTDAPELPAKMLAKSCYGNTFQKCESIIDAPELNVTALADNCYSSMFYGCISLTTVPNLPAPELTTMCYYQMFFGCSGLKIEENGTGTPFFTCPKEIPTLAVTNMFSGTSGTFTGTPTAGNSYGLQVEQPITGKCGDNLEYIYYRDVGNLVIFGTGAMWDYGIGKEHGEHAPWYNDISILTAVELPEGLTKIGDKAFEYCSFTDLKLPSTLFYIGDNAFYQCLNIKAQITFPAKMEHIGNYAFYNCPGLFGLIDISSPALNDIGEYAFYKCDSIEAVVIQQAQKIGDCAFQHCVNMKGVKFGSSIKEIGAYAFASDRALAELVLPQGIAVIGNNAFANCIGIQGELNIPDNCVIIGEYAFSDCSGLMDIRIGKSVREIGAYAFYGCYGLDKNTLIFTGEEPTFVANSLSIGVDEQRRVSVNVDAPDWATLEKFQKFSNPYTTFVFEPTPVITGQCGDNLFYEYSTSGGYLTITGTGEMWDYSMESPPDWFNDRQSFTKVNLPSGITKIGYGAFYEMINVPNIDIPQSVMIISGGAFSSSGLTSIKLPKMLIDIGYGAFANCEKLGGNLTIPENVRIIGDSAFAGTGISSLALGQGVQVIDQYAFAECPKLSGTIVIPASVEQINKNAFSEDFGITAFIFKPANKFKTEDNTFNIGTESHPMTINVSGSDWVMEGAFDTRELGKFTTFKYAEPPVPPTPGMAVPYNKIDRVGWINSAMVSGECKQEDYVMGGIALRLDFKPDIVLGVQADNGYTGFFDITTQRLKLFMPDGTEGVNVDIIKYTIVLMKE